MQEAIQDNSLFSFMLANNRHQRPSYITKNEYYWVTRVSKCEKKAIKMYLLAPFLALNQLQRQRQIED